MINMPVKKDLKTRPRLVVFSVVGAVVVAGLIFGAYGWFLKRQEKVLGGFARPTFPYSNYSVEELGAMYPQYANENVATVRTPEETHKMFVEKLKVGDLNGAVECCVVKGNQKEMIDLLNGVKARGQWGLMLGDIGEIRKDFVGDTIATYIYSGTLDSQKVANFFRFIKNNQGIWLIKSL